MVVMTCRTTISVQQPDTCRQASGKPYKASMRSVRLDKSYLAIQLSKNIDFRRPFSTGQDFLRDTSASFFGGRLDSF